MPCVTCGSQDSVAQPRAPGQIETATNQPDRGSHSSLGVTPRLNLTRANLSCESVALRPVPRHPTEGHSMTKRLDRKLATIRAGAYKPTDFIIADAKDGDMAFGITAPGPSAGCERRRRGRFRSA